MPSTVSVVIPCFNLGRFLAEAIESAAAQTAPPLEIVVVDDGSTDADTRDVLARVDPRLARVVRSEENRGLSAARNLGVRESKGHLICCLDADDRLAPTWLEQAREVLDEDARVAFVSHWLRTFGDEQWDWRPVRCDLAILLDVNMVNGAAVFRRELFDAIGGFDESMRDGCEDWEYWIRATEAGWSGVIVPEILYEYRRRRESMSRQMIVGESPFRLYATLVSKHRNSFAERLPDLLLRREWSLGELSRSLVMLRNEIDGRLSSALVERKRELETARTRLQQLQAAEALAERVEAADALNAPARQEAAAQQAQVQAMAEQIRVLDGERQALRQSWSWRITRPMRAAFGWLGGKKQ